MTPCVLKWAAGNRTFTWRRFAGVEPVQRRRVFKHLATFGHLSGRTMRYDPFAGTLCHLIPD